MKKIISLSVFVGVFFVSSSALADLSSFGQTPKVGMVVSVKSTPAGSFDCPKAPKRTGKVLASDNEDNNGDMQSRVRSQIIRTTSSAREHN